MKGKGWVCWGGAIDGGLRVSAGCGHEGEVREGAGSRHEGER
jgi:hypothetical protein